MVNYFDDTRLLYFALSMAVIFMAVWIVGSLFSNGKNNEKLRKKVLKGQFISLNDFNKNWIIRRGEIGYKYLDTPGCYVILIFDKPVKKKKFSNYRNVYIGQSIHVMSRVQQHFTGHGNGDVYADIKYGKHVYVQIIPCKAKSLNATEIDLIEAFDATRSYNRTKGGSKVTMLKTKRS